MIEAFIGALFGAMIGVVGGIYITLKCIKKVLKTTKPIIGFFEIYED